MIRRNLESKLTIGLTAVVLALLAASACQLIYSGAPQSPPVQQLPEVDSERAGSEQPRSVHQVKYDPTAAADKDINFELADPEGKYIAVAYSSGGSSEFRGFSINNKNYQAECDDDRFGEAVKLNGYAALRLNSLAIRNGEFYRETDRDSYVRLENIEIAGQAIYFRTLPVSGIAYEFVGTFMITGNLYHLDPEMKIMEGTLSKRLGETTVSKINIAFKWKPDLSRRGRC